MPQVVEKTGNGQARTHNIELVPGCCIEIRVFTSLTGPIPGALSLFTELSGLQLPDNQLSGSIPADLLCLKFLYILLLHKNQLSGSIGGAPAITCQWFWVFENQLTGRLPQNLLAVKQLLASGNMLEGTVPKVMTSHLSMLAISGQPGQTGALTGHLPAVIRRCRVLLFLAASWQVLAGVIPPFATTLQTLSLQNNNFKVMSDARFEDRKSKIFKGSSVLVHNNLLSCDLPRCGKEVVKISLSGLGNQLSFPKQAFPEWVTPLDRDRLFWVTDREGLELLMKVIGASGLLFMTAAIKGHGYRFSKWHAQPGNHLKIACQCFAFLACISRRALLRVPLLMLLLSWDLYKCPQTMSLASACLRNESDTLTRGLSLLMWGYVGFHGQTVQLLTGHAGGEACAAQTLSKKTSRRPKRKGLSMSSTRKPKRRPSSSLPVVLFVFLQVILSSPAILLQVCKSVPGSFSEGGVWVGTMISACIGGVQAVLGSFVIPHLADKLTSRKHVYTTLANLLLNGVFPAAVVMGLDTSCFGNWVALWGPCRQDPQQFVQEYTTPGMTITLSKPYEVCSEGPQSQLNRVSLRVKN